MGVKQHSVYNVILSPGCEIAQCVQCYTVTWVWNSTVCTMLYCHMGVKQHSVYNVILSRGCETAQCVQCYTVTWVWNSTVCTMLYCHRVWNSIVCTMLYCHRGVKQHSVYNVILSHGCETAQCAYSVPTLCCFTSMWQYNIVHLPGYLNTQSLNQNTVKTGQNQHNTALTKLPFASTSSCFCGLYWQFKQLVVRLQNFEFTGLIITCWS